MATAHRIEYLCPSVAGDLLTIRTRLADIKEAGCVRHDESTHTGGPNAIARGMIKRVFADEAPGRPGRVLPGIRDRLEPGSLSRPPGEGSDVWVNSSTTVQ